MWCNVMMGQDMTAFEGVYLGYHCPETKKQIKSWGRGFAWNPKEEVE